MDHKRLILFMALSMGVLIAWQQFVIWKWGIPIDADPEADVAQNDNANANPDAEAESN